MKRSKVTDYAALNQTVDTPGIDHWCDFRCGTSTLFDVVQLMCHMLNKCHIKLSNIHLYPKHYILKPTKCYDFES